MSLGVALVADLVTIVVFAAGRLRGVSFLAAVFLAAVFFAAVFFATGFLAADFLAACFFAGFFFSVISDTLVSFVDRFLHSDSIF